MHIDSVPDVAKTYSSIADEFSRTRFNHWNKVKHFIQSLNKCTILLDIGCGNGKYTTVRNDLLYVGCDITRELLLHASALQSPKDLFQTSCEQLPLRNQIADAAICIAVLHHIHGFDERVKVVIGILERLKPPARALITVWAYEQNNTTKRDTKWTRICPTSTDYLVPWRGNHHRFYHLFTQTEVRELCAAVKKEFPLATYSIAFELDNWVIEWFLPN